MKDAKGRTQTLHRNRRRHRLQSQMRGGECDTQESVIGFTSQHHHHMLSTSFFSQIFGMATKSNTRLIQNAFLYRRGNNRIDLALQRCFDGAIEHLQYRLTIACIKLTWTRRYR